MEIQFGTTIDREGEDKFTVHFTATVRTHSEAVQVQRFVEGAIKDAAGRQKVKKSPLILPQSYLNSFRRG
jgi:hypothetical protein